MSIQSIIGYRISRQIKQPGIIIIAQNATKLDAGKLERLGTRILEKGEIVHIAKANGKLYQIPDELAERANEAYQKAIAARAN